MGRIRFCPNLSGFSVALLASATMFIAGCSGSETATPSGPSTIAAPASSSSSVGANVTGQMRRTVRELMTLQTPWRGTVTVSHDRAGALRWKMEGSGLANEAVDAVLADTLGNRLDMILDVMTNKKGVFRTSRKTYAGSLPDPFHAELRDRFTAEVLARALIDPDEIR